MRTKPITRLFATIILPLLGCCCAPREPAAPARPAIYDGPTEPLVEVVQAINRNVEPLPTVWARHYYEATIVNPDTGNATFVNGDGVLLYRRPMGFRLVGKKLTETAFEVGSTDEFYWLQVGGDTERLWFGEHRFVGRPCVEQVPIQPNLVMEVLGIGLIGTDFTQFPAPVMRFNPDADAYMFLWVAPAGGPGAGPQRLVAQREIWYDRQTKLPELVILFDADGRPVLRATLSGHRPVEVEDLPRERWPVLATDYRLYFPDTRSRISFTLEEVLLENRGVPTRRGIVFPGATPEEAGVREVIKLDRNCTD